MDNAAAQSMATDITVIGLTGGIATGKSTCSAILLKLCPELVFFDADACVKNLYSDQGVIVDLETHFGSKLYDSNGSINKAYLRRRVFDEPAEKKFLEGVFHPRVQKECLALLAQTATNPLSRLFVADIPLLFENGFDFGQSANLLVATSRETQIDRLKNRNAWDDKTVEAVLSSQLPIEAKLSLADMVFWNEGPKTMLEKQCVRFLESL